MKTSAASVDRKKWAVVDDEQVVLDVLQAYLERQTDSKICLFQSPNDAYEAILADPGGFEMIVTDRNMPQMDGVGLLVLVREAAPHLRMLMVTGNSYRLEHELKLFELPVHYVSKPFTTQDIEEAVENAPAISGKIEVLKEHDQSHRADVASMPNRNVARSKTVTVAALSAAASSTVIPVIS